MLLIILLLMSLIYGEYLADVHFSELVS